MCTLENPDVHVLVSNTSITLFNVKPCIYKLYTVLLQDGNSPLHLAYGGGFDEIVEMLLQRGANKTLTNQVSL